MRRVTREGIAQLLDHPAGRGMSGYVEMKDSPSTVVDGEPDVEEVEPDGGHDEEVHAGNHLPVVPKEGHPPPVRILAGLVLR